MAIGKQNAREEELAGFLRWADAAGFRIAEHPDYGGVTNVHTSGSWHYDGLAADLNWGPVGTSTTERKKFKKAIKVARSFGLGVIYALNGTHGSAAGHRTHLHVDCGSSTNLGDAYTKTPAGDRRVQRVQHALHFPMVERDNLAGPDTRKRRDAVRAASKMGGSHFPWGVSFTQACVGTTRDEKWGAASRAAHDETVRDLQDAVGLKRTGVYDAALDRALSDLLG
jgi:hypothetical protein